LREGPITADASARRESSQTVLTGRVREYMVKVFERVEDRGIYDGVFLAYVTGLVNQQLLLQNEYLIAENRILRSRLPARVPLTNAQGATLAEIAKRIGRRGRTGSLRPNQRPSWLGTAN
jgi:hypothetical protein